MSEIIIKVKSGINGEFLFIPLSQLEMFPTSFIMTMVKFKLSQLDEKDGDQNLEIVLYDDFRVIRSVLNYYMYQVLLLADELNNETFYEIVMDKFFPEVKEEPIISDERKVIDEICAKIEQKTRDFIGNKCEKLAKNIKNQVITDCKNFLIKNRQIKLKYDIFTNFENFDIYLKQDYLHIKYMLCGNYYDYYDKYDDKFYHPYEKYDNNLIRRILIEKLEKVIGLKFEILDINNNKDVVIYAM